MAPRPIRSWRSTRQPRSFLESLAWITRIRESPSVRSASSTRRLQPSRETTSYPAAWTWQVSRQKATRSLASARRRISASWESSCPRQAPCPAAVSRRTSTPVSARERASSRPRATRSIPASSPSPMCDPGWRTRCGIPVAAHRAISSTRAVTERARTTASEEARLIRYAECDTSEEIPASAAAVRKTEASSPEIGLPAHWLELFVKTWSARQPAATARSTARGSPPAALMCAPTSGPAPGRAGRLTRRSPRAPSSGIGASGSATGRSAWRSSATARRRGSRRPRSAARPSRGGSGAPSPGP